MPKTLAIIGSSRSGGETSSIVESVIGDQKAEIIELNSKNISPFDYEHKNSEDDFVAIAEKMAASDAIIFATPVYWYAMSAQLKTFFDRFTDLITIKKDIGRNLKGKKCYLVCCGSEKQMPEGFEVPFSATCNYLDMEYKGCLYCCTGKKESEKTATEEVAAFNEKVFG